MTACLTYYYLMRESRKKNIARQKAELEKNAKLDATPTESV